MSKKIEKSGWNNEENGYSRDEVLIGLIIIMKLIVTKTIEKMANNIGLSFDDVYNFIKNNWDQWFLKLNSPLDNTIAYKWYIDGVKRIIIFAVTTNWLIYPVYIGDKHDTIAKNITGDIVRKNAEHWLRTIQKDIQDKTFKIRHF